MKRDHSAIARKAWRTRRRMKLAREQARKSAARTHGGSAGGQIVLSRDLQHYRRKLPCPDFGARR
jgi:hypothetical protein